ncbi:uncharacterized protein LOC123551469 isoform X2 [Mercenaria mercenaria]|uniref:uncharacterized protein LOC123551469 isoform X2 n=1 Tax=Mercenaria mercenaria TaxID=6596 RepID=UPI00234ECC0A|nr:uncharacterized protein LOC123551469 isoform X2 [Mercenaria mercenaria]
MDRHKCKILFNKCILAIGPEKQGCQICLGRFLPEMTSEIAFAIVFGSVVIMIFLYIGYSTYYGTPREEKQKHSRFNDFLMRIYNEEIRMQPNWKDSEYQDIESSVRETIEDIIYVALFCDKELHVDRNKVHCYVELVGSCQEQTKIKRPDEFDFSIKLPYFSKENIQVEEGMLKPRKFRCKHKVSFKNDNAFVQLVYKVKKGNPSENSVIQGFLKVDGDKSYLSAYSIHTFFKNRVVDALNKLHPIVKSKDTGTLTSPHKEVEGVLFPDEIRCLVENGPALKVPLVWKGNSGNFFCIDVDIVPVIVIGESSLDINFDTVEDMRNVSMNANRFVPYPALCAILGITRFEHKTDSEGKRSIKEYKTFEYIIENATSYDKPFIECSFLKSFADTENRLMHRVKETHNSLFICYQILKDMVHFWPIYSQNGKVHGVTFTCYVIKTTLLEKYVDKKFDQNDDVAKCFRKMMNILNKISESSLSKKHQVIQSPWFKKHIIRCTKYAGSETCRQNSLDISRNNVGSLYKLINTLSEDVNLSQHYQDYKKRFLSITKSEQRGTIHMV